MSEVEQTDHTQSNGKIHFHFLRETYVYDKEVQPAPGICEVFGKTVRHPLQQHLKDEDVGENLVRKFQHGFDRLLLLNVDIFKCLE